MEWHYDRTERSIKDTFLAAAAHRGTRARRALLRGHAVMAAVFAVALLLVLHPWRMSLSERVAAGIVLGIYLMLYALLVAAGRQRYAWGQIRILRRRDLLRHALGPQTVRLTDTELQIIGSQPTGTGEFRCPLAELREAVAARGGVLVILCNGQVEFLPAQAFSEAQPVPACVTLLNAAIARARQSAPGCAAADATPARPDAPAAANAAPGMQGFAPDGLGGGTLRFALEPPQAAQLCRELNRNLLCSAGYWAGQWRSLLPLAVLMLLVGLLGGAWVMLGYLLLVVAILAAASLWMAFGPQKTKGLEAICGPQTLCLLPGGIHVERPNGQWDFRYGDFTQLIETQNGVFFYRQRRNVMLPIPKTAFRSPQEQQTFCALAQAKLARRD